MTDFLQKEQVKRGYEPVVTPLIGNTQLFIKSGHLANYREKMYPLMAVDDDEEYALKPMNCPFHIEIYASQMRSYRDLPVRLAEFGTVHRFEQRGKWRAFCALAASRKMTLTCSSVLTSFSMNSSPSLI